MVYYQRELLINVLGPELCSLGVVDFPIFYPIISVLQDTIEFFHDQNPLRDIKRPRNLVCLCCIDYAFD